MAPHVGFDCRHRRADVRLLAQVSVIDKIERLNGSRDIGFDANQVDVARIVVEECGKADPLANRLYDCVHRA